MHVVQCAAFQLTNNGNFTSEYGHISTALYQSNPNCELAGKISIESEHFVFLGNALGANIVRSELYQCMQTIQHENSCQYLSNHIIIPLYSLFLAAT